MKKIKEIFYSLQGEGRHTGVAAVFVRFAGCNLRCPFCDTDFQGGTEMSDLEIVETVKACCPVPDQLPLIVLTGGEPTLQLDTDLLHYFYTTFPSAELCLETNGTHPVPAGIDWVTCSPKGAPVVLSHVNEVKLVYPGTVDPESLDITADYYYLQPCAVDDPVQTERHVQACIQYIKEHPKWRLSLQTHKITGIQ